MYKVGDIFYIDEEYSTRADFCNQNNLRIVEIEADEIGRRFKIIENIITEKNTLSNELNELLTWFDIFYAQHEQKYRRLHTLNKLTDDEKDPYNELINLYNEAEIKRSRIHEIEALLNE